MVELKVLVIQICYLVLYGVWTRYLGRCCWLWETAEVCWYQRKIPVTKDIKPVTRHILLFRGLRPMINTHCVNG